LVLCLSLLLAAVHAETEADSNEETQMNEVQQEQVEDAEDMEQAVTEEQTEQEDEIAADLNTALLQLDSQTRKAKATATETTTEVTRHRGEDDEGGSADGGGGAASNAESCEVCVYILENKQQHQSYLCRSLTAKSQQQICVRVLESLVWWITNEVYWVNYGCQRKSPNGGTEWVRPCPAHVICGWIQDLYERKPFCNADPNYPTP